MMRRAALLLLLFTAAITRAQTPSAGECAELVRKGDSYFVQKRFQEAKAEFENARKCPGEKAYAEAQLQEIDKQIGEARAMAREQKFAEAMAEGDRAMAAGEFEKAKKAYEVAVEIKPYDIDAKLKLHKASDNAPKSDTSVTVIIPNAFNPNGERINYWAVDYKGPPLMQFELSVYNRWGITVFKSSDPKARWTGRDEKDVALPAEVYYYAVTLTPAGGKKRSYSGFVTLIR